MKKGKETKGTKSLKISEEVHKKLKMYCVQENVSMAEFADSAILSKLVIKSEYKKKIIDK